jgi:hydroxymethylpyrimidine/phosphomethylpyrimidine kinase
VLTIAGSDSSGGAGIQADLKAIEACGCHAATAITAITAQNTLGVRKAEVLAPALVREQIRAVLDDLDVRAVKSGMLGDAAVVRAVAAEIAERPELPYVLDPVLVSQTGHSLFDRQALDDLRSALVPRAWLVTPNALEAGVLAGTGPVEGPEDARRAGKTLLDLGARAVLVKGGHFADRRGTDVLVTPAGVREFVAAAIDTPHTHGSGCTYSAAIAACLALGHDLADAIGRAKTFVTEAIRHGAAIGRGAGPTDPFHAWRRAAEERPSRGGS